ncbi:Permease of the drug/metabolite transporter (DMT) superfamily [Haladaptatus litoreus]|uniref:Permease of the drug/metabolite transporter (DMT) superfamily n=1 Tax=Haladaptatus litoreus TaxID=553468 RepID=A0A1N6Y8G7_9EURY|nr:DMT family transporter [Haladaptatus litoreus]SIR10878.1 Permease of the drug/metabolite transporter (DMT) superfamily [Haladaptatus litoreus]
MSRTTIISAFLVLSALWGSSFAAIRLGLPSMPPVLFAALRFYLAGAVMLAYAVHSQTRWRPRGDDWKTVAVGALFFIAAHHAFLFVGEQYVTSAVAGVIISLDPVLAAGFAALLLPDERLSGVGVVGLLFGLVGATIVANPSPENLVGSDARGVVLVFLAAAAFALGAVLTRRFRTDLPAVSMQAWMMLVGAVVLHAVSLALPSERLADVEWTVDAILALGYLSFVAGGIGFLLYFALLDEIGPVEINLVGYVAPLFAGLSGWVVLGEPIEETTVAGFTVIVVGFALLKRRALRDAF